MRADARAERYGGPAHSVGDVARGYVAVLLLYAVALVVMAVVSSIGQPAAALGWAPVLVLGGLVVGAPALALTVPIALLVERAARRLGWGLRFGLQVLAGGVLGAATGWIAFGASSGGWWLTLVGAAAGAVLAAVGRGVAERSIRARALERR